MYLDFSGSTVQVSVISESSFTSSHTGSPLRRLEVKAVLRSQLENENFLSLLEEARAEGASSVDEEGNIICRWRIENNSWHHTQGTSVYHHSLEIEEIEELELDYLVVGEMTLRPYAYQERFDEGYLIIEASVLLSDDENEELAVLLEESDYLQVFRYGINEQPVEMRFGLCYWSEHEHGTKHLLTLVGKEADEEPNPLKKAFMWVESTRKQTAKNKATIEALLSALTLRGVLGTEEIEQVRTEALESSWGMEHELYRVEDVDDL
ncbi:MAG: hypothetical protein GF383_16870 [Candidatus Lokiarchaeota archaeon]|nr:hypothetical protein [Candidatus Lokiarchaeota archaeon]